jgi:hypothetical protein
MNHKAVVGFEALGSSAQPAVPELIKIFEENISADSECETANSLGCIGPAANQAIPALLGGLTNSNYDVRQQIIRTLLQLHAETNRQAVMAFVQNFADPDLVVPAWQSLWGTPPMMSEELFSTASQAIALRRSKRFRRWSSA